MMKSLEDLERAFDRGLNAWETEIVIGQARKMGVKAVREIKRKTPHITGNLRRNWKSDAQKDGRDVVVTIQNPVEYAAYVNDGHRIVSRSGKTIGQKEGKHMLEKGITAYKDTYLQDDLNAMIEALNRKMGG